MGIEQSLYLLSKSLCINIKKPPKTVKDYKKDILQEVGFLLEREEDVRHTRLRFPECSLESIVGFLKSIINNDRYAVIRFQVDGGRSGGGYPTLYVHGDDFVSETIRDNCIFIPKNGGLDPQIISCDGRIIDYKRNVILDVFDRQNSVKVEMGGLARFTERKVGLGGGFRLLFETTESIGNRIFLKATLSMMFDDVGPRSTHQESKYDKKQFFYEINVSFYFDGTKLTPVLPTKQKKVSLEKSDPSYISLLILKRLFEQDGVAISLLLSGLFTLRGERNTHSIEGVYGFSDKHENSLNVRVIDFDGLTTTSQWLEDNHINKNEISRIINYGNIIFTAHLKLMGLI